MALTSIELVEEFSRVNEHAQNLSAKQIKDIVYAPWRFFKQEMESGELPEVRFKYFGKFQVKLNRAKYMLKKLEIDYKNDKFAEERYIELKTMLKNFLKEKENE